MSCATGNEVGSPATDAATRLVVEGWTKAQITADNAVRQGVVNLGQLQQVAQQLAAIPLSQVNVDGISLSISQLLLPDTPEIGTLPVFDGGQTATSLGWSEGDYDSDLLTLLKARIAPLVEGESTGLDPDVEYRLWERARNRERITARAAIDAAMAQAAGRGWRRPPGAMLVELQRALQDERVAISGVNREITIKQAELEQTNRQFAIGKAWDIEQGLQTYVGQSHARQLDAAKATAALINDVYRVAIERYTADVRAITDIFKAQGDVYSATVNGQAAGIKAQADAFQSQVQYVKAKAEAQIENAKVNLQKMVAAVGVLADIAKAAGQMQSQIAASALSAVNLSGGISTSGSDSNSQSRSYTCSDSTVESKSESYSQSDSISQTFNHNYSE